MSNLGTIPYFKQICPSFTCFVLLEFLLRVVWEKKRLSELKALSGAAGRIESQPAIRGQRTCIHILAGLTC